MKTLKQTVPTRFGTPTRFEIKPAVAPFRVTQETELEKLKGRLLQEMLAACQEPALNAPLRRAANEAAAIAWMTPFPLLFFPGLLDEKAQQARRQAEKQRQVFARTQRIFAQAA